MQEGADMVARLGGEEIAVLLDGVDNLDDLRNIAEILRTAIEMTPFSIDKNDSNRVIPLTISIGGLLISGLDSNEAMRGADINLYKAKEMRNCSVVSETLAKTI